MDTGTYPQPDVARYINEHFIPLRVWLEKREHWGVFRSNQVIWTPTTGFMDRNGSMHYHAPGYLPAPEFISALKIGRARCLMAWTRSAEAAVELESASADGNSFAAEALWWWGAALFLERRDSSRMWGPWRRLQALYPESPWARRVYTRPSKDTDREG